MLFRSMDDGIRQMLLEVFDRLLTMNDVNRMKFCHRNAVSHLLKVGRARQTWVHRGGGGR